MVAEMEVPPPSAFPEVALVMSSVGVGQAAVHRLGCIQEQVALLKQALDDHATVESMQAALDFLSEEAERIKQEIRDDVVTPGTSFLSQIGLNVSLEVRDAA